MTTLTCPTCGKPLDPMHAPVARIRSARVVTFCSVDCADGGQLAAGSQKAPTVVAPASAAAPPDAAPDKTSPPAAAPKKRARTAPVAPAAAASLVEPAVATDPRRATPAAIVTSKTAASAAAVSPTAPLRAEATAKRRRRGPIIVALLLVLAGGAALFAFEVYPRLTGDASDPQRPEAIPRAARPVPAAESQPRPPVAPNHSAVFNAAVEELKALTKSTSPRVQRLAAQALARTGDAEALALLRTLLVEETSQLGKIQIAYALARAGDRQAIDLLKRELRAEKRDARLKAAEGLVQLGDDSGRNTLRAMLEVDTHRIGAAGVLARLGDPEGLKVLRAELTAKQTPSEVRMRAAVALGRAGDASVKPTLIEILADKRYNVGAADALAALGDAAAVEPLTAQLRTIIGEMRVPAALWLRRMKQEVDLEPLLVALEAGDEPSRVSAAEALVVLTGPDNLAERD